MHNVTKHFKEQAKTLKELTDNSKLQHKCFKCKSNDLDYHESYDTDGFVYEEYICIDCKHEGKFIYSVEFISNE